MNRIILILSFILVPFSCTIASPYWAPRGVVNWQYQLSGNISTNVNAEVFSIDLFDTTASKISALKKKGAKLICYFSAGSFEDWRPDAAAFPASIKGKTNHWPGEKWLDIRRTDILRPIMEARIKKCKTKGFDAIEPDNVDGYENDTGFKLTKADQIAYNTMLAELGHAQGLGVGLKNTGDLVTELLPMFDFATVEQCFQHRECNLYQPFTTAGKAVLAVEYKKGCPQNIPQGFSVLVKNLNLTAPRTCCAGC